MEHMADAEPPLTGQERANIISWCIDEIGRKKINNDDVVALLESYNNADLTGLYDLILSVRGTRSHREMLSLVLEEDMPLIRLVFKYVESLMRGDISVSEMSLIVSGLRSIDVMSPEDEDCPGMLAHIAVGRGVLRDKNQNPYHWDDDLMRVVHEYPDRIDEIRMYRMNRGCDSGGLREHMKAPPALAEGAL